MSVADYMAKWTEGGSNKTSKKERETLAAQVLEMTTLAKTVGKDAVKVMNQQTGKMEKQYKFDQALMKSIEAQGKIAQQLIDGQDLDKKQRSDLTQLMTEFYKAVDGYSVSSTKYVNRLNKAITEELPDMIKKRLTNDAMHVKKYERTDASSNKKVAGDESNAILFKNIKDIKYLVNQHVGIATKTNDFLNNTWESLSYTMGNFMDKVADYFEKSDWLSDLLKTAFMLLGTGVLKGLWDQIKETHFGKWLQAETTKFLDNLKNFTIQLSKFSLAMPNFVLNIAKALHKLRALGRWSRMKLAKQFAGPLKVINKVFKGTAEVVGRATKVAGPVGGFFRKIQGGFKLIGATFKGFGKIAVMIGKWSVKLAKISKAIPGFGTAVMAIGGIFDAINGWKNVTGSKWDKVLGALSNILSGLSFGLVKDKTIFNFAKKQHMTKGTYQSTEERRRAQKAKEEAAGNGYSPVSSMPVNIGHGDGEKKRVPMGQRLLQAARRVVGGNSHPGGWCLRGVNKALGMVGLPTARVRSAYMAAPIFARSGKFSVQNGVDPSSLGGLPGGSIVVWGKGTTPHGHISIADGRGNEYSDFVGSQRRKTSRRDGLHYGLPSVFTPKGTSTVPLPKGSSDYSTDSVNGATGSFDGDTMADPMQDYWSAIDVLMGARGTATAGSSSGIGMGGFLDNVGGYLSSKNGAFANIANTLASQFAPEYSGAISAVTDSGKGFSMKNIGKAAMNYASSNIQGASQATSAYNQYKGMQTSGKTLNEIMNEAKQNPSKTAKTVASQAMQLPQARQAAKVVEIADTDLQLLQSLIF